MSSRKIPLASGEYFHVFNRGVDKRSIFNDDEDVERFLLSMASFNTEEPIGSLYELSFKKTESKRQTQTRLVEIIAFCLNPNHFHLLLTSKFDRGVERFMQRVGTGYTMYFNNKYTRTGALFQGKFKAVHIANNTQLLHVSAYVNLNDKKHQLGGKASKLVRSSWDEYRKYARGRQGREDCLCSPDVILDQFQSAAHYQRFAREAMQGIIERKNQEFDEELLLE